MMTSSNTKKWDIMLWWDKFKAIMFETGTPSTKEFIFNRITVLTHGDFRTGNIFFKYDNYNRVSEVKVIDWQFSKENNPVMDLIIFFVQNISIEMMEAHGIGLFYFYLDKLNNNLASLKAKRSYNIYELSGSAHSPWKSVKAGVPQGSALGPILYVLYTADIPVSPDVSNLVFTDDTALLSTSSNLETATLALQQHLDHIFEWSEQCKIRVNPTKSAHINFTMRHSVDLPLFACGDWRENSHKMESKIPWTAF
ncbi:hypothetical protein V9T40_001905 [Parthenolecanium corni]|uniref:Reverse transcriptase domain-containing protein n=1 Tax=Parthenolecanium corni TaxID=536013 RepID=A0AAN9TTJ5_9HEMI